MLLLCIKIVITVFQALPAALRKLGPSTSPGLDLPWQVVRDALDYMAQAAADHIDKEHFSVFWESLQVSYISTFYCRIFFFFCVSRWPLSAVQLAVQEVLGMAEASREKEVVEHLERLLFILHTLVSHRDGDKVTKPEAVCQVSPGKEDVLIAMSFLLLLITSVCATRRFWS